MKIKAEVAFEDSLKTVPVITWSTHNESDVSHRGLQILIDSEEVSIDLVIPWKFLLDFVKENTVNFSNTSRRADPKRRW